MPGGESVSETFDNIREWNEFGARLQTILKKVADEIGDAPLYVTEDGEFYIHPHVTKILSEPGNEGPLEFLQYMQRNRIGLDEDE